MMTLPNIEELKRITQALATLDLIICPDWEDRYYSFDSQWSATEQMASMRNGCGDDWFILFDESGHVGIKGLDHESPAARDAELVGQIRSALPPEFADFANEPAFHWEATSFCYWRMAGHDQWSEAPEQRSAETGAEELLGILNRPSVGYHRFASEYYEQELEASVLEHVLQLRPITSEIVTSLNPAIRLEDIRQDLAQVGYPR